MICFSNLKHLFSFVFYNYCFTYNNEFNLGSNYVDIEIVMHNVVNALFGH